MAWTTGPSMVIALGLYWVIGRQYHGEGIHSDQLDAILKGLEGGFNLNPWLLLVPGLILALVVLKIPALPSLMLGAVAGGTAAMLFQGRTLAEVLAVAYEGYASSTGVKSVDELLTRGGMSSMYSTVALILCAMCFGGVMERSGMLGRIADAILSLAKGRGGMVSATLGSSLGINVLAADQYLSIVVPGRMYREAFARQGLHPKNLSRCLEDAGTLTSPLVPWNSCGAYMHATLGVFPLAYLPFAFLNLVNPLISALYGYTGWTMTKADEPLTPADGRAAETKP
jgi:Na+:H+ antiporter, NhaC family